MSGILNTTGAVSGILGTTTAAPVSAILAKQTILQHKTSTDSWYTNSTTNTAVHDGVSFSATSGNTYLVTYNICPDIWCTGSAATHRQAALTLYHHTSATSASATSGLGTAFVYERVGRIIPNSSDGLSHYGAFLMQGAFVAGSTATMYITLGVNINGSTQVRVMLPLASYYQFYTIEEYTGNVLDASTLVE